MTDNYHKEVEASMIQKFLNDMSLMCGDSVVEKGVRLYLFSHDKTVVKIPNHEQDSIS